MILKKNLALALGLFTLVLGCDPEELLPGPLESAGASTEQRPGMPEDGPDPQADPPQRPDPADRERPDPPEEPQEPDQPEQPQEPDQPEQPQEPDQPEQPQEPDQPEQPEPEDSDVELFARNPTDNVATLAKIELGRLLFWDPILSGDRDVACGTCHHPDFGYADGLPLSIGVGGEGLGPDRELSEDRVFVGRNAPTVLNTGLNGWTNPGRLPRAESAPMFWDHRTESLESQALGPIANDIEMRSDAYPEAEAVDHVVERLDAVPAYQALFASAFDEDPVDAVSGENLAKAIAAFERHLSRPDSAFDRFLDGERGALSARQIRGEQAFRQAGCTACHGGPMLSDYRLHRIGAPDNPDRGSVDTGDGAFRFRAPSLRNIALTGPYMHGGVFDTLDEVLRFYAARGRPAPGAPPPRGAPQIGPLDPAFLNLRFSPQQAGDIVAFLEALSDDDFDTNIPDEVPSGLPVGGAIR